MYVRTRVRWYRRTEKRETKRNREKEEEEMEEEEGLTLRSCSYLTSDRNRPKVNPRRGRFI